MNIYKISQNINNNYETYDSCIVLAESEDLARSNNLPFDGPNYYYGSWVKESDKDKLIVEFMGQLVGDHHIPIVLLSSFNAG